MLDIMNLQRVKNVRGSEPPNKIERDNNTVGMYQSPAGLRNLWWGSEPTSKIKKTYWDVPEPLWLT